MDHPVSSYKLKCEKKILCFEYWKIYQIIISIPYLLFFKLGPLDFSTILWKSSKLSKMDVSYIFSDRFDSASSKMAIKNGQAGTGSRKFKYTEV